MEANPGKQEDLSYAILEVMGEAGRRRAREHFPLGAMVRQMEQIYTVLLERRLPA